MWRRPVYDVLDFESEPVTSAVYMLVAVCPAGVLHFVLFFVFWLRALLGSASGCSRSFDEELGEEDAKPEEVALKTLATSEP